MELLIGLGTAVFAIIHLVRRAYPKIQGWLAIAAALALAAVGVYLFDINTFAAMTDAELEAWVEEVLSVFATFASSGLVHKVWGKLSA